MLFIKRRNRKTETLQGRLETEFHDHAVVIDEKDLCKFPGEIAAIGSRFVDGLALGRREGDRHLRKSKF